MISLRPSHERGRTTLSWLESAHTFAFNNYFDVQAHEPPAPDNPLSKMDNVILTPHAAYYSTAAVAQVPQRCGEEVARVLTGQRPLHVVNPEVYAVMIPPRGR
jgi:phosphoglycerate dehydrogenase-like enzyme